MKRAALAEIKKVLLEELAEPVVSLKQLLAPFQHAYDIFTQMVKKIKEAWLGLVLGSVFNSGHLRVKLLHSYAQYTIILCAVLKINVAS